MSIKDNIRRLRESRDLTQQELADVLGVNRATIAQWETGTSYPRMGTALQLCEYFAISLNDLADEKPEPRPVELLGDVRELVDLYGRMTDEGRQQLMIYARGLAQTYPKNTADSVSA